MSIRFGSISSWEQAAVWVVCIIIGSLGIGEWPTGVLAPLWRRIINKRCWLEATVACSCLEVVMSDNQDHKYTLYYFDAKGRAEPVRVLFAVAGVPFHDVRIDFKNWASFKKQTPMGQLPYLDVDDGKLQLCQSRAIMRYLAKTFGNGLAGKTKSDAAKCDMYVDGCVDLLEKAIPWLLETDEEKKKELWKTFSKTQLNPFLDRYGRFLHKNPSGFFVGNEMTWADVMIFTTLAGIEQQQPGIFKHHEEFHDFIARMKAVKTIKRYIRDNW